MLTKLPLHSGKAGIVFVLAPDAAGGALLLR
jgi:hypothetical protein